MMSLALSLLAAFQAGQSVALFLPAAPVPKIVAELSKATGVPMAATMVLGKDIVTIDVHDRPLSEVMERLAKTLDASWKNDKGTFRLNRSDAQSTAQENTERQYREKQIAAEISRSKALRDGTLTLEDAKKLRQQFEKLREKNPRYSFDPYGELSGAISMAPARRALIRLIAQLDLSEVSLLEPGDRIAYSNKPTHTERQFSFPIEDLLGRFVAEQNVWAEAAGTVSEGGPSRMADDPLDANQAITQSPDRILLIANRTNSSALVTFSLFLIAGEKTVGTANAWIGTDSIRKMSREMFANAPAAGTKITLSPSSLKILQATKGFGRPAQGPAPGPTTDVVDLISHPDKIDPLALVATDGFVSVAAAKHLNLIASLPDELIALNFVPNPSAQTLEGFLQAASGYGDLDVSEKDGWLIAKPAKAYSARLIRVDRTALATYLSSIVATGRASLDAQGQFALVAQPSDYDTVGMPIGMLIDINSTQNVDKDWVTLKLWGSLTREQRSLLVSGQKIAFKDLTPEQSGLVEREAFHRSFKSISGEINVEAGDIRRYMEPTECLPNGLPPNGTLSVTAQSAPAILASSTTVNVRMSFARVFDAAGLGSSLAYYEGASPDSNPMFDRYQIVQRVNYSFVYRYDGVVSDRSDLHDIVVPADSTPVAFADLPKDVQDQVLAAKADEKQKLAAEPAKRVPPP